MYEISVEAGSRDGNTLINKENPCSGKSGKVFWHLPNLCIINEASEKQEESQYQEHPPEPVLSIKISRKVGRKSDN